MNQTFAENQVEREEHKFIVFFLCDDEDQTVHVEEAEDIDLSQVFQHLNLGGSVFITHRRFPEHDISSRNERSKKCRMIQLGLIKAEGSGRWKYYRISKGFRDL